MSAVMTYTSLVADVLGYVVRTDDAALIAQVPRLVMLAENRVATDLKVKGSTKVVANTFTVGSSELPKPAFWRDTVSFQVTRADGTKFNLLPRAYEYCRNYWPNPALTGVPRFYADYGFDNFFIVPPPPSALEFELTYHTRLDPLDPANQTNWITVNAPQLLFYAVMAETHLYLKNTEDFATWGAMYKDALGGLSSEDSARRDDATTVPK